MKKIFILMAMIFQMVCAFADEMLIRKAIEDMHSSVLVEKPWLSARSSALVENANKPDEFEWDNLKDNDVTTCWCEGVRGPGINEYVLMFIDHENGLEFDYGRAQRFKNIKCHLEINNGFCKGQDLFVKNNRVKTCRIEIYDTPEVYGQYETFIRADPVKIYDSVLELADTSETQEFEFFIKLREDNIYAGAIVLMQLTILDVYPGTDYDDTCISEIKVYGEYAE